MEVMHDELTTITPADWVPGPAQGDWTYEAYAALTADGECYEIVQGVLVMSPAPGLPHQKIAWTISRYLSEMIEDQGLGEVFMAPVDVILAPQEVYQPDVLVVLQSHASRMQEQGIIGPPDLVVEVISPSSVLYDRVNKHMAYERAGVPEYWLVHTMKRAVEVFVLENWKYRSLGLFHGEQTLPSRVVQPMTTPVAHFFARAEKLLDPSSS